MPALSRSITVTARSQMPSGRPTTIRSGRFTSRVAKERIPMNSKIIAELREARENGRHTGATRISSTLEVMDALLAHIAAQDRALKQCGEVITDLVAIVEQLRFYPTGKLQVRSLDYPAVTDAKIVLALPEVQKAMKGK